MARPATLYFLDGRCFDLSPARVVFIYTVSVLLVYILCAPKAPISIKCVAALSVYSTEGDKSISVFDFLTHWFACRVIRHFCFVKKYLSLEMSNCDGLLEQGKKVRCVKQSLSMLVFFFSVLLTFLLPRQLARRQVLELKIWTLIILETSVSHKSSRTFLENSGDAIAPFHSSLLSSSLSLYLFFLQRAKLF